MTEIARILSIPSVMYTPGADPGVRWRKHRGAPPLLDDQVRFLLACVDAANEPPTASGGAVGALGFMSCGSGKTLALQLAPHIFGVSRERCLLLTKAGLLKQLRQDIDTWGRHYTLADPPVMSYGKLSHPTAEHILEQRQPLLILADECHTIGQKARLKRLWRYFEAHRNARFVAVSGSLMDSEVARMADIAALALRHWCPFPFNGGVLEHWSSVLDAGGEYSQMDYGALEPLVRWAGVPDGKPRARARAAVRTRLQSCPGVVVTSGPLNVGASLGIRLRKPTPSEALEQLVQSWVLPDGTQLVDMLEYYRHHRTLSLGFYYRWDPDTVYPEWMAARKAWNGVVQGHIEYGSFDTPYFVCQAAEQARLRSGDMYVYHRWRDAARRYDPPTRETVWVDERKLRTFVRIWWRANKGHGRIVWYHSAAVGDFARRLGWRVHPAGEPPPRVASDTPTLVSLAHRTGWNAESGSTVFSRALVLEPPTTAREIEQLLARHHRRGQLADDVVFTLASDTSTYWALHQRCQAVHDMTAAPQRYILADRL